MVPVIITTLCRYEHFVRCIESLKANDLAPQTELYIGLDYPAKESHVEGWKKIKDYLNDGIEGFLKVNCISHTHNLGPSENFRVVREVVYEKYDRYIFSEDDNLFEASFLSFMNMCMDKYSEDKKIFSVCPYKYPIDTMDIQGNVFKLPMYTSAFGYGIFKDANDYFDDEITYERIKSYYCNFSKMRALKKVSKNQYCNFVKAMLEYTPDFFRGGEFRRTTDLIYGLFSFFEGFTNVFSLDNMVINNGYDGSGENCEVIQNTDDAEKSKQYRFYDFSKQKMENNHSLTSGAIEEADDDTLILERLNAFFYVTRKELFLCDISYFVSRVLGIDNIKKLIGRLKGKK